MKEFNELIEIVDSLLSPNGCPWDQAQTLQSVRASLLEETCEVIEAIDLNDPMHIQEELGDLFFNVIFLCKLAEKFDQFDLRSVLVEINKKLIHRHPHVFGTKKLENVDQVLNQWEEIKQKEKGKENRNGLESIPKNLPALLRAQKVIKKVKKIDPQTLPTEETKIDFHDEHTLGIELMKIVSKASKLNIDPEQALKSTLSKLEQSLRKN